MSKQSGAAVSERAPAITEDLLYFVQCFGFLLPRNSSTDVQAFAELIESRYDVSNPRTRETVEYLKSKPREMVVKRDWQGFAVSMNKKA